MSQPRGRGGHGNRKQSVSFQKMFNIWKYIFMDPVLKNNIEFVKTESRW